MSWSLAQLSKRIRDELPEVEHTIKRAIEGLQRAKISGDDYYLDGVALNLHSFYSGLERLFELIAVHVDGALPKGENWHKMLLKQMTEEITDIRPAVISESVRQGLEEYRGFRHVVRNVYTYNFDSARIEKLMLNAAQLFTQIQAELLAVAEFMEASEEEDNEKS